MNPMLKQTLALQWKATRWALLPFMLAAFGMPLVALRQAQAAAQAPLSGSAALAVLEVLQLWTPLFPAAALGLGTVVGLAVWNWDHRANHVYALSLPVARWEYALLKFAAGVVILVAPVVALLAGVLLGLTGLDLPPELHAYPFAFTLRFLLAAVIVYAVMFALAAGTMRTAIWVISLFLAFLIFGSLLVDVARALFGVANVPTPIDLLNDALVHFPGPLHVFGGNWMMIDV